MVATDLIDGRQNANQNSVLEYSFQLKASFGSHSLARNRSAPKAQRTNGKLSLARQSTGTARGSLSMRPLRRRREYSYGTPKSWALASMHVCAEQTVHYSTGWMDGSARTRVQSAKDINRLSAAEMPRQNAQTVDNSLDGTEGTDGRDHQRFGLDQRPRREWMFEALGAERTCSVAFGVDGRDIRAEIQQQSHHTLVPAHTSAATLLC
jgi:hypothetical protein